MCEHNKYMLKDLELAEYTCLLPAQTGLECCIHIDESNSFRRWAHPMWVIVSDGNPYENPWVAISVSESPEIICYGNWNPEIKEQFSFPIQGCKEFVRLFNIALKDIAEERVDSSVIYDILERTGINWESADIHTLYDTLIPQYELDANQVSFKS